MRNKSEDTCRSCWTQWNTVDRVENRDFIFEMFFMLIRKSNILQNEVAVRVAICMWQKRAVIFDSCSWRMHFISIPSSAKCTGRDKRSVKNFFLYSCARAFLNKFKPELLELSSFNIAFLQFKLQANISRLVTQHRITPTRSCLFERCAGETRDSTRLSILLTDVSIHEIIKALSWFRALQE